MHPFIKLASIYKLLMTPKPNKAITRLIKTVIAKIHS